MYCFLFCDWGMDRSIESKRFVNSGFPADGTGDGRTDGRTDGYVSFNLVVSRARARDFFPLEGFRYIVRRYV